MAVGVYLSIVAHTGAVLGSVTQKGRVGCIQAYSMRHEIVAPRDPASGLPTGKRVHKPLAFSTDVDQATPRLYYAATNNENLPYVRADFWGSTAFGVEKLKFVIDLTNATLCSVLLKHPDTRNKRLAHLTLTTELSFTYERITWSWVEGNVSATDDWQRPRT